MTSLVPFQFESQTVRVVNTEFGPEFVALAR